MPIHTKNRSFLLQYWFKPLLYRLNFFKTTLDSPFKTSSLFPIHCGFSPKRTPSDPDIEPHHQIFVGHYIPISHVVVPQTKTFTQRSPQTNLELFISLFRICIVILTWTRKYSKSSTQSHAKPNTQHLKYQINVLVSLLRA